MGGFVFNNLTEPGELHGDNWSVMKYLQVEKKDKW